MLFISFRAHWSTIVGSLIVTIHASASVVREMLSALRTRKNVVWARKVRGFSSGEVMSDATLLKQRLQ